ncbi:MAG: (4Fe-4S)-binding protein [Peptococcaceae bacterium BRH_c4b]|nr:MAG: (4Fe-4S)-binding protein [Peptococcaceae bacterium BRH_c4b]
MKLAVASGKGGTGKTTVSVSLAITMAQRKRVAFLDCDVEEPNGHLMLNPVLQHKEMVAVLVPEIDEQKCDSCGYCAEICAFHALAVLPGNTLVFPEMCHACGGCWNFCPKQAITPVDNYIGVVEEGRAEKVRFVHGRLNVGVAMSPPLIRAVKAKAKNDELTIIDVPPGTSCPAVKSVEGVDFCILVTEPTPFGLHDLDLAVQVLHQLKIPCGVVINRSDGLDLTVEEYCGRCKIPVLQKIPLDREVAEGYAAGIPAVLVKKEWGELFSELMDKVEEVVSS